MKYRKKPVVIDAVQLTWPNWSDVCKVAGVGRIEDGKPMGCCVDADGHALPEGEGSERMGLLIPTREGLMTAVEGDWIIKGVKGEIYACKPDIFEMTYEAVEGK